MLTRWVTPAEFSVLCSDISQDLPALRRRESFAAPQHKGPSPFQRGTPVGSSSSAPPRGHLPGVTVQQLRLSRRQKRDVLGVLSNR